MGAYLWIVNNFSILFLACSGKLLRCILNCVDLTLSVLLCNDDVIIEQSRLCNMDYINVVCNIITLSSFVPTNVLYCALLILIRLIHINSLEARLQVA